MWWKRKNKRPKAIPEHLFDDFDKALRELKEAIEKIQTYKNNL